MSVKPPTYLSSSALFPAWDPSHPATSCSWMFLDQNLRLMSDHAFSVAAQKLWNSSITCSSSVKPSRLNFRLTCFLSRRRAFKVLSLSFYPSVFSILHLLLQLLIYAFGIALVCSHFCFIFTIFFFYFNVVILLYSTWVVFKCAL